MPDRYKKVVVISRRDVYAFHHSVKREPLTSIDDMISDTEMLRYILHGRYSLSLSLPLKAGMTVSIQLHLY